MFREFWGLKSYNEQQSFLRPLIRPALVKRRRHGTYEDPSDSRRQRTFKYLLILNNTSEVQVCKKTFCETFGVAQRRVQLLAQRILTGYIDVKDKRGGSRPKRDGVWKQKIHDYIESIPARKSHYGREDNRSRKYLSPDLNVSKLYRGFIEKYTVDDKKPPVSRQWFHDIFLRDFNLSFGSPRVDTCSACDRGKIAIDSSPTEQLKAVEKTKLELHHRQAEAAQKQMKVDIAMSMLPTSETQTVSFDLQQQMYLPYLTHSEMYYSRQLAIVNLGIHLENEERGIMFFWDETAGRRGASEIASCLYTFFTTRHLGLSPKQKLILWSDNCCGQNKNRGMLAMMLTLVAKGYFTDITHKFPVRGHTFLSCDRDFAVIEKAKRGKTPVVPRDLVKIIAHANQKHPFLVVNNTDFFEWMEVADQLLDTKKMCISKATMIKVTKENFGVIQVKKCYSSLGQWSQVPVLKKNVSEEVFHNLIVEMRKKVIPLSKEKKKDITAMMPYLPKDKKKFYERLLVLE